MERNIKGSNIRIGVAIAVIVVLLLLVIFPVKSMLDDGGTVDSVGQLPEFDKYALPDVGEEESWSTYLETPYSSTLLIDGAGTVELLLNKTLEAYPTDMAAEDILASVKEGSYVVFEDSRLTAGNAVWKNFYEKVRKKKAAQVRLVKYYTLGDESRYSPEYYEQIKDEYPKLFFLSVVYVPEEGFYINDRPSTMNEPEIETKCFPYLKHFEGDAPTASATYSRYDRYVLVDDNSATWEKIEHQMFSSYYDPNEKSIAWRDVYCNFID